MFSIVKKLLLVTMIILMSACVDVSDEESSSSSSDATSTSYQETSESLNSRSKNLTLSGQDFVEKFNALSLFDPESATGDEIVAPLEEMLVAAEALHADLEIYQSLLLQYDAQLNHKASPMRQSVDPLLILDIANLVKEGKKEADVINELIKSGEDPTAAREAVAAYKKKHLGNAFRTGVSTLVGGGAGAVAGLVAASVSAPVLVVTGAAIGTGVVVGAIWSWCTSPSNAIGLREGDNHVCSMAMIEESVVELPNGEKGLAITLPQGGPGSLCMHVEGKAPLCIDTSIQEGGNTITATCFDSNFDPDASKSCNAEVDNNNAITLLGSSCEADVVAINASATVHGDATVTIHTSLPTQGCSISYSLVGTDGYTQSGTLISNSSGTVSFDVPEGEDGVFDSVTISEGASGSTTTVGYSF